METLHVIKYSNRKLYSTEFGRYLTHREVIKAVLGGRHIMATDYKSGKDITKEVLWSGFNCTANDLPLSTIRSLITTFAR